MENGVRAERICYYGAGLDPHSCFELPVGSILAPSKIEAPKAHFNC
jgi:hypothetical protein